MNQHTRNRLLAALALVLVAALPAVGYADHRDGPAESTGEQIDETAQDLREGAEKGLKKAGEALEKTGEAISEEAQEAAEAVDGDGDGE